MHQCSNCKKKKDIIRSAVKNGVYLKDMCDGCLNSSVGFADKARAFEREWQQREFARDLIQPQDPDFPRAYGGQAAHDRGWSDEAIRRLT